MVQTIVLPRRSILAAIALTPILAATPAQAAFSVADFLQFGKLIGDAANGIDRAIDTVTHAGTAFFQGLDKVTRRGQKAKLTNLSKILSDTFIGQVGLIDAIDAYGDDWRNYTGSGRRAPSPSQTALLRNSWSKILEEAERVLTQIRSALASLQLDGRDAVISSTYTALGEALEAKRGVLERMKRLPPPLTGSELSQLVDKEENFIRLRLSLKSAVSRLNDLILSIPS